MASLRRRPHLVYAVTHPVTARVLLRGQLEFMSRAGFEVTVISAPGRELDDVGRRDGVRVVEVPMQREIAPRQDVRALVAMAKSLAALRPDVLNASTAKAALLSNTTATALRIPARVYLVRGLRFEGATGTKQRILRAAEHVACSAAHEIVCVSESVRTKLVLEGFAPRSKTHVLGAGSSNGVDADRFAPTEEHRRHARAIRAELGIPTAAPVIGFIGRLVEDKGIAELARAFASVRRTCPEAVLLLVGASFAGEALEPSVRALEGDPSVRIVGEVREPAPYYAAMDILAFGSKREGFPNVPLEAAASEVPVVGFRVTGVVDAVADGRTGTLVPPGDVDGFAAALRRYVEAPALRGEHGRAARERVLSSLTNERVWQQWLTFYERVLQERSLPGPGV